MALYFRRFMQLYSRCHVPTRHFRPMHSVGPKLGRSFGEQARRMPPLAQPCPEEVQR